MKLRKAFVKLPRSEDLQLILQSFCNASKTKYIKPILVVSTRWNSTDNNMMEVALKMRSSLDLFWQNCAKVIDFKLNDDELFLLIQIHNFLSDFKKVSTLLGGDQYVTLTLLIVAFNLLMTKIDKTIFALAKKPDRNSVDDILLLAFQKGRDKMLKHYHKTNWLYCSSLILDPRFKVETFNLTEWEQEMKDASIKFFENIFRPEYCDFETTENQTINGNDADNSTNLTKVMMSLM